MKECLIYDLISSFGAIAEWIAAICLYCYSLVPIYLVQYWPIQWPVQLTSSDPSGQLRSKLQRQSNGMHCWVPHRNWLLPHRVRFPDSTPAHRKQILSVTERDYIGKISIFICYCISWIQFSLTPPSPPNITVIPYLTLSLTSFCVIYTSAYASGRKMVAGPNKTTAKKCGSLPLLYVFSTVTYVYSSIQWALFALARERIHKSLFDKILRLVAGSYLQSWIFLRFCIS
jgi:hypothetical protein